MTDFWQRLRAPFLASVGMALMLGLSACKSSHGIRGIPTELPKINLAGSTTTPPSSLANYEYPFNADGSYVTEWAAEGERRAGRGAAVESRDSNRKSKAVAYKKSSTKSRTASSSSKGKSKSGGGGGGYTVKKGDTLSAIARRNGTTVAKLKSANGLASDNIGIGKKLRIP